MSFLVKAPSHPPTVYPSRRGSRTWSHLHLGRATSGFTRSDTGTYPLIPYPGQEYIGSEKAVHQVDKWDFTDEKLEYATHGPSGEKGDGSSAEGEEVGEDVQRRTIHWLRRPRAEEGEWFAEEEHKATKWLSLFYDLVVVAVLTVFSSTHDLSTPSTIPTFLSYFTIILWVWASQIHYDIRYEGEDILHRFFKALQIGCFVYIGAASGNWDPGVITTPVDGDEKVASRIDAASESFTTVLSAYAISRGLLMVQYLITAFAGRKVGRNIIAQLVAAGCLAGSFVVVVIVGALPATSEVLMIVKLSLLYASMAIEIIGLVLQHKRYTDRSFNTAAIVERYGALTLIILGEGFISITKAFNRAIGGLAESNCATYGQVFLSIAIIYVIWMILFGDFDEKCDIPRSKALLWEFIHFPLHFALLLLLAAIVNNIVIISYAHGVKSVLVGFEGTIGSIAAQPNSTMGDGSRTQIGMYLDRLTLEPDYMTEYTYLQQLAIDDTPEEDPQILAYQYLGQIILQTTIMYGIEISDTALSTFQDLYSVNTTYTPDLGTTARRREIASEYLIRFIEIPVDESLTGILWLFPTAGGVLVISALRAAISFKRIGPAQWLMGLAGVGLALLGLLDIGPKGIDVMEEDYLAKTNRMYRLLGSRWPLVIIMGVYYGVYLGGCIASGLFEKNRGREKAIGKSAVPQQLAYQDCLKLP